MRDVLVKSLPYVLLHARKYIYTASLKKIKKKTLFEKHHGVYILRHENIYTLLISLDFQAFIHFIKSCHQYEKFYPCNIDIDWLSEHRRQLMLLKSKTS